MPQRHLLYLSAHQLSAHAWKGGRLDAQASFPHSEEGLVAFRQYLEKRRHNLFYLLINVADEGFQLDTIPFLQGKDREAVIQRKLGQYFYSTNLNMAQRLGFEKNRRKDERLLLAGFTNPAQIMPWTALIQSLGVPLVGIYSLPLLGPQLLKKLQPGPAPCLMLTVQDHSLRQSFFDKGELHFSRLVPLHDSSIHGIGHAMAAEAAKMHQYLTSQRLLARGQSLQALALVHPQAVRAVQEACSDSPAVTFRIVGNDEAARLIGLADAPEDSRSEALFLHLLAVQTPAQQFAPPPLRHDYRVWQLKALLSSGGLLVFLACLLFAGKQLYDATRLGSERAAIQAQADSAAQRYAELARTFPPMPVDNDTLRQVINRYQAMERQPTTPRDFYLLLSRALEATPQVELDTIAWQRGGTSAGGNGNATAAAAAPGEGDESALVRGSIPTGPQANPRQVLAIFERFLAALRQQPGLQVNVQQQPFDVESGKSLKGGSSSDDAPASAEPRHFVVQIVHRVTP